MRLQLLLRRLRLLLPVVWQNKKKEQHQEMERNVSSQDESDAILKPTPRRSHQ